MLSSTVGLEGLTLGGLAEDLQLSKSGLFAHFDSKEAIQLAVLQAARERFVGEVIAPALAKPRGEPRVRAFFKAHLHWLEHSPFPGGCIFFSASMEYDDRPGPMRDLLVGSQRDWLEALAKGAQIAVQEEHFRPNLDVEQFAHEMQSIALGFNYALKLLKDKRARQRAETAFEALLARARPA